MSAFSVPFLQPYLDIYHPRFNERTRVTGKKGWRESWQVFYYCVGHGCVMANVWLPGKKSLSIQPPKFRMRFHFDRQDLPPNRWALSFSRRWGTRPNWPCTMKWWWAWKTTRYRRRSALMPPVWVCFVFFFSRRTRKKSVSLVSHRTKKTPFRVACCVFRVCVGQFVYIRTCCLFVFFRSRKGLSLRTSLEQSQKMKKSYKSFESCHRERRDRAIIL